jgi:hypothetical protein
VKTVVLIQHPYELRRALEIAGRHARLVIEPRAEARTTHMTDPFGDRDRLARDGKTFVDVAEADRDVRPDPRDVDLPPHVAG